MQSHQVRWNVSLSNGENYREGHSPFHESENDESPWGRLKRYIDISGLEITSLWLSTPAGARHHLPSRGKRGGNPKLRAFDMAGKPITLRCFRRLAAEGTTLQELAEGEDRALYTIAEADYGTYRVQIFVSESDPNVSWVLVT